jgi:hypothetical protein
MAAPAQMGGGPYARVSAGSSLSGGQNGDYITRATVPEGTDINADDLVWTRGVPTTIMEGTLCAEHRRVRLAAWTNHEERRVRQAAPRGCRHRCRTHMRVIISWPPQHRFDPQAVRLAVDKWLDAVMPDARVVAAIHVDRDHSHVHLWVSAETTNGRKLVLPDEQYRTLDEQWNDIYCEMTGYDPRVHLGKKKETVHFWREVRAEGFRDRMRGVSRTPGEIEAALGGKPLRFAGYRKRPLDPRLHELGGVVREIERIWSMERERGFRIPGLDPGPAEEVLARLVDAVRADAGLRPQLERLPALRHGARCMPGLPGATSSCSSGRTRSFIISNARRRCRRW